MISDRFLRFGVVGCVGFLVDIGALTLALREGANPYTARGFSFACAVTVTWLLNRIYTFRDRSRGRAEQWLRFATVNAIGGILNYTTYALMVWQLPFVRAWPVIGVAAGSLVGMFFNYELSKRLVFGQR